MSLLALQRGFRDHILAAEAQGAPPVAVARTDGLSVYRHAYRAQLVACLRDTFEKTWSWLGDEAFDAAAEHHVAGHPSSAWTLADYGATFPATLAARLPDDPEVAELARLDWALRRAFDGEGGQPITADALAHVDWETAVLTFAPTLAVDDITTNAVAIWTALAEEVQPPPPQTLPQPAAVRVWRADLSPRYRAIDALEAHVLRQAMAGVGFAALCEDLAARLDDPEEAAPRAGGFLGAWLQDGLVVAIG